MFTGKAWRAVALGVPEKVLELRRHTFETPPAGRLLVKVRASGVGLPDMLMMEGSYPGMSALPAPGQEVAGEVVAAPSGSAYAVGDRVMGLTPFLEGIGGCAEYTYVREEKTWRIPSTFSDEQAAGFIIAFRTAYASLVQRISLAEGQTLLVLGASGSSGSAVIQLGKALGATVIAVAGSQEQRDFCARIGADHTVDHKTEDVAARARELTSGAGVDVLFDVVGGEPGTKALRALARDGQVAIVGYAAGSWLTIDTMDMVRRNYSAVGVFAGGFTPQEDAEAYGRLCELAEQKVIATPVGSVRDFDDVPAVIADLRSPRYGKTIVRVS